VKPTSGRASAWRRTASMQCASSVASVLRNLRRAGVLKNSSLTSTVVPVARAAGRSSPLRASSRKALAWPGQRDSMAARTPRRWRPAPRREAHGGHRFQVLQRADLAGGVAAQRQRQFLAGDAAPSSSTEIRRTPPASRRTVTWVAPASSALSTSSRTTDAGRSTTSPAAIWLTNSSGRSRIGRRWPGWSTAFTADSRWAGR
jgi:hypothetical protein